MTASFLCITTWQLSLFENAPAPPVRTGTLLQVGKGYASRSRCLCAAITDKEFVTAMGILREFKWPWRRFWLSKALVDEWRCKAASIAMAYDRRPSNLDLTRLLSLMSPDAWSDDSAYGPCQPFAWPDDPMHYRVSFI